MDLAEWITQLDNEGMNRLLHFAFSELAFLEGATGRINIVDITIRPKESEIPMTYESVSLIRESGAHRKGAIKAMSELLGRKNPGKNVKQNIAILVKNRRHAHETDADYAGADHS